jgi:cell division protein FtsB
MPAHASASARRAPARRTSVTRLPARQSRVRWDRIGRLALLFVLVGLLYLYIGPARSYWATFHNAKAKRAEVARLERENGRLRARQRALHQPSTLETEARRLGMVRPGEVPYVVRHLPKR